MGTEKVRLELLEQKLARYRDLARKYPDGEIALVIRDFIEEMERQIHSPEARPPQLAASFILPHRVARRPGIRQADARHQPII